MSCHLSTEQVNSVIESVKPYMGPGKRIELKCREPLCDSPYCKLDTDWFLHQLKKAVEMRNVLLCSDLYSAFLSLKKFEK